MATCDLCNSKFPGSKATHCSRTDLRRAVKGGLRPGPSLVVQGGTGSIEDIQAEVRWLEQVMSDSTDWLLCQECTRKTKECLAKNEAPKCANPQCDKPVPRKNEGGWHKCCSPMCAVFMGENIPISVSSATKYQPGPLMLIFSLVSFIAFWSIGGLIGYFIKGGEGAILGVFANFLVGLAICFVVWIINTVREWWYE